MDPSRLEGVVPKQAVCAHCGYQFGGAAIKNGCVRCPECGRDTDFAAIFRRRARSERIGRRQRRARRFVAFVLLLIVLTLVLLLPVALR